LLPADASRVRDSTSEAHRGVIAAVLALWIAMAVAWGWAAGMAFGFVVAIALVRMAGVMLGGTRHIAFGVEDLAATLEQLEARRN
jgi:hypothetical protein